MLQVAAGTIHAAVGRGDGGCRPPWDRVYASVSILAVGATGWTGEAPAQTTAPTRWMNGKRTALIQRFSNQWPLKVQHSPHSSTHSHTDGGFDHARRRPARREHLRVRRVAQGHLDTQLGGPL